MEVTTARFLLREFVEADRPAFLAYHADPRNVAFYGPDEARPEHAGHLFETFQAWASERPRLNYQLAIVHRQEPQALVGCCGLRGAGRPAGEAELGLELAPDFWGRHGYAVEVGRALVDFGFGELMLDVISGSTVSGNVRIARMAEWFGAEVVATLPGPSWMSARDWSEVHWRIARERWEAHQSSSNRGARLHRRPPPWRRNG